VHAPARMGMWATQRPANMPTRAATILRDVLSLGARVSMAPASPGNAEFRAELPWVDSTDSARIRASDYNQRIVSRIRRKLMSGHGRPDRQFRKRRLGSAGRIAVQAIFLTAALAGVAGSAAAQSVTPDDGSAEHPPGNPIALAARPDACLRDVTFIDAKRGWAVGDCGAIWHTADGGEHWEQQSSGVDCRLESVCFLDAEIGWAAGGFTLPYSHISTGVILRTTDGGQHWTRLEKLLLPAIHSVKLFDSKHGWAIGSASAIDPGDVLFTDNGAREWTPITVNSNHDRGADITGDFSTARNGAVVSQDGKISLLHGKDVKWVQSIDYGEFAGPRFTPLRRMRLSEAGTGWIVGDERLVYHTVDGGETWQKPDGEIPLTTEERFGPGGIQQINFAAVAVRGPKVWIAGSLGSIIFHSDDDGKSWTMQPTPQTLPIEALSFLDDQHGCAVGALGTILATDDGGQTWRRQRGGGDHVALMGIFSEANDVPLDLFAKASASDGYLSVVELLNRRDLETPSCNDASLAARASEALAMLGVQDVLTEFLFPLRQRGLDMPVEKTVAVWDQLADGSGVAQLEARIVRQIQAWRPEVVVVSDVDEHSDPVRQLLQRVILQAIDRAADPKGDAESKEPRPLTPALARPSTSSGQAGERENSPSTSLPGQSAAAWRVKRVFAVASAGQTSGTTLASSQLVPRLGRSLAEMTSLPRGVLLDEYSPAPDAISFRLLRADDQPSIRGGDLFAGLDLRPGSGARRMLAEPTAEAIDSLRRASVQRRNLQAILKRTADSPDRWLSQIGSLTAGLDESSAGEILFQLGWQSYRSGQWESAAQAFELLSAEHPRHPLTSTARLWLLHYYASEIAAHRLRAGKVPDLAAVLPAAANLPLDRPAAPAVRLAAGSNSPNAAGKESPLQHATQLGQQIERTDPALFAEPDVRFPLAAAYRKLGMTREAERCLANVRFGPHDAWWSCAEAENCFAQGRGIPPKSVWHCTRTAKHPRLDGVLDDAAWETAKSVELHSTLHDDADWPAIAMLAYDEQFLYLAVRCHQAADADYAAAIGPRPRNADLSRRDRIDFLLCPDRDYATFYRISIDYRGWVNTACCGDASWRPALFVAAATVEGTWTVEAAIPWSELVDHPPRASDRQAWAANIQRIIPGVGFQNWSAPATIEIRPEGFDYLEFD
jgi:photosystem II stability/assembly factor-like uncharacterized protein